MEHGDLLLKQSIDFRWDHCLSTLLTTAVTDYAIGDKTCRISINTSQLQPMQSATTVAPNKNELQRVAFAAPWKELEPTAMLVNLENRPHPSEMLSKHINSSISTLKKQQVSTGDLRGSLNDFTKNWHQLFTIYSICSSIQQCKYPSKYKHASKH